MAYTGSFKDGEFDCIFQREWDTRRDFLFSTSMIKDLSSIFAKYFYDLIL